MREVSAPSIPNGVRRLGAPDVPEFVAALFSPARTHPVVAVTTSATTGEPHVDPGRLAAGLGAQAEVLVLETGEATWALSEALPEKLEVYGGAVRIWWPGLTTESNPYDHPLLFARSPEDGEQVLRRVLALLRPGTVPAEDPWARVAGAYRSGDVVEGVVLSVRPIGAFVELLPGAAGLVRKGELDWTFVTDPAEIVRPGESVKVLILRLDPAGRQANLSIKRAWNREPLPRIAGGPEPPPLPAGPLPPGGGPADAPAPDVRARQLEAELEALREDRANLLRRLRDLQKELRSATDRLAHLERQGGGEATGSEPAFLQAVRVAYARLFSEDERRRYPLRRMRAGPAFLDRMRALAGVSTEKVLEVCAQVAAGRAHEIPAREVHRLRQGERGAGHVTRRRDGATAWRCSLQDATPPARRLHWWASPGADGGTIEFASVGVHDDYGIPE